MTIAHGVREYYEGFNVEIEKQEGNSRWVVVALNEGGYNSTAVDLIDLINWVSANKPELLE
jgi:hypothetical protein